MKTDIQQYCLRLPRSVYSDALDVASVFGLSMNRFLLAAVREYVESQLQQEKIKGAVAKSREARQAGLAHGHLETDERFKQLSD
jgi:hypothetical protein